MNSHSIFKDKQVLSSWGYSLSNILFGVILLPLIITTLNTEEINVWLLFLSIISVSDLIVLGFDTTFVRFVSYTKTGIHFSQFPKISSNQVHKKEFNKTEQLNDIFSINIIIFLLIAIVYIFSVLIIGYIFLEKPLNYLMNPDLGWISWFTLVLSHGFKISLYTYPVFIQGLNSVSTYYNTMTFFRLLNIVLATIVLLYSPSIIGLSITFAVSTVLVSTTHYLFIKLQRIIPQKLEFTLFRKNIFRIIWDSAWKSGISKVTAPIILNVSGIILSQVVSPVISSSYLLTQRVFNVLQSISNVTVNSKLPTIAMYRGIGEVVKAKSIIRRVSFIAYLVLIAGYMVLVVGSDKILTMINANTNFVDFPMLTLFAFAYLLNRHLGIQLNLANQANNVIEHIALPLYAIVYFLFIIVLWDNLNVWVFPVAMIVGVLVADIFVIPRSYKLYNTTFFQMEKRNFIPLFLILGIISFFFWILLRL